LESIDMYAFSGSTIRNFTIPKSLKYLNYSAFFKAMNIERFEIEEGNTKYKVVDDILFTIDGETLYLYPSGKKDLTCVISEGVKTIGGWSFAGNEFLKEVTIPKSLTTIGGSAFYSTSELETVNISDDSELTTILESAFIYTKITTFKITEKVSYIYGGALAADNLINYEVSENNSVYKEIDGVIHSKDGKAIIAYPPGRTGTYTIVDGTEKILREAFEYSKLDTVTIPTSVYEIEMLGLGYTYFKYLIIPSTVSKMGNWAVEAAYNTALNVFVELTEKPSTWSWKWAAENVTVYYKPNWEIVDGVPQPIP